MKKMQIRPTTGAKEKVFIIDGVIEFNLQKKCLLNLTTHAKKKLYSTSARCLCLLLEKKGTLISYNELLIHIWPDKYKSVSHNNLYQCILSLRRDFIDVGYKGKIIITIPRKGIYIPSEINLSTDEYQKSIHQLQLQSTTVDSFKEYNSTFSFRNHIYNNIFISVSAAVLAMLVSFFIYHIINKNYFSDYIYLRDSNECKIFIKDKTSDIERREDFIKKEKNICSRHEQLYLTIYSGVRRVSAIVCKGNFYFFTENTCTSYYYPNYEDTENEK